MEERTVNNRIQKMIEELYPDGVEYKKLKDICTIRNGYTPSKKHSEYWEDGTVPWFRMDDIRTHGRVLSDSLQYVTPQAVKGQLFQADSLIFATTATIGEHAIIGVPFLCNQRFTVLTIRDEMKEALEPMYLFHYGFIIDEWCKRNTKSGTMAAVDMNKFREIEIPIPPLQVQEEIVRMLDAFTNLTAELTTELATELAMRTKQYAYYRDEMLKLENVEGVKHKEIAEVSTYEQPGHYIVHSTDYDDAFDTPVLTAGQTFILGYTDETDGIYNASKQQPVILFDDFTGALKWVDFPFKVKSSATKFIKSCDGVMLRYLYYCMCSLDFSSKEHKRLWISKYSHFEIPVPPFPVQQDIVTRLDAFSSYCTDLTSGLPAEIEARDKQYAYYRDAILQFNGK